ncbi:MAG TPA: hypothetical protein VMI11_06680 [Actinomycetes bacterium]|nr:hypothetical protein [Actinomycetes bacterium]
MATVHVTLSSQLAPQVVLAAGRDFSARRADVFPAVSTDHLEVHNLHPDSADVTEGTPTGIGLNWERCRYDWATPGVVTATVVDSNVYEPSSSRWVLRVEPDSSGSVIEMVWVREFRSGPRGRMFGTLFRLLGKRVFTHYAEEVLRNLESLEIAGR